MISCRRSAPRTWWSRARRSAAARRWCRRASCSASRPSSATRSGARCSAPASATCELARALETPAPTRPLSRPRAASPTRRLFPRTPQRHGDRDAGARSLFDLRPPHPQARRARARRGGAGRGRARHHHPRHPRRLRRGSSRGAAAARLARTSCSAARTRSREIADAFPELYAEWWPRFERLAAEFVVWEDGAPRRDRHDPRGTLRIAAHGLAGRQRVHLAGPRRPHRSAPRRQASPSSISRPARRRATKRSFAGFSPQLTLEAAMLMEGAFTDVPAAPETPDLLYVQISGGRKPLEPRPVEPPRGRHAARSPTWSPSTAAEFGRAGRLLRRGRGGLPVPALPEIRQPLLRLRPPRPGQGMVARERPASEGGAMSVERGADFVVPNDTLAEQRRAADPRASAWVSANAGAGKTKVLTDRVVRLLLAGRAAGPASCASPSPRRPPPTWRSASSSGSDAG